MEQEGSPPPMRGKGVCSLTDSLFHGITPAYAGKRSLQSYGQPFSWDHPRLCGEKVHGYRIHRLEGGSPPPMRGKVFLAPLVLSVIRITPAYAGKRGETATVNVGFEDHPRLCGEKWGSQVHTWTKQGSPPPMRGKGHIRAIDTVVEGITPAYAGKSEKSRLVSEQI